VVSGASPGDHDLHRTVDDRLRSREQRYTDGRRRIVEVLAGAGAPVTLPELLAGNAELAQSSAYRNLAVLEEAGVVRRLVHGADHAYFELAEDLTEHHHHLICEQCGRVQDVALGGAIESSLDDALTGLGRERGFTPRRHTIDIYGFCSNCSA
jgi:Fe2+ or Zn2+ uptake regulation protein